MALTTITPFQRKNTALGNTTLLGGWDDFHRDMDRLFDSFFGGGVTAALPARGTGGAVQPLLMSLDVSETDKVYTIHADLPGLEQKDVEVTLAEGILTLRAERHRENMSENMRENAGENGQEEKQEGQEKKVTWHRSERSFGSVQRTLQLPADADENKVAATMKNGVLEIEIGKTEKAQPISKKIEIRSE